VPIPIQSGSMSDRLRKFFRIRGKTGFVLDEVVAPVVLVQDLTQGPYQAGVTPAAGVSEVTAVGTSRFGFAIILNDKTGSITPVLDDQFNGRTFSFTHAELSNRDIPATTLLDLRLRLCTRAAVFGAPLPTGSSQLTSIQSNDGTETVPVEIFAFDDQNIAGRDIWRGTLGDNTNTLGSVKEFRNLKPNITIGPEDALVFSQVSIDAATTGLIRVSVRGFYQLQPE